MTASVFVATTWLGAFLLFQIQPLVARYLLPLFGGGPGVWSTCMLFFQVVLLGGYMYAHALQRIPHVRRQTLVHAALLTASLVALPLALGGIRPSTGDPQWQILGVLAASIGLPVFALSATGPLLQAWFHHARSDMRAYRLYAVSNAGSLLALLSYPTLVEPWLSRGAQAAAWSWGFRGFLLGMGAVAFVLWRHAPLAAPSATPAPAHRDADAVDMRQRVAWFGWPCLASVLLLAITNVMCQDVVVIPLLWVLPLGLYLLTFVVAFDSPRWYRRGVFLPAAAIASATLCLLALYDMGLPLAWQVGVYSAGLFVCALTCHGEVYRARPHATHLTHFYLFIAAGGAAGGVCVVLLAPLLSDSYGELPLALWVMGVAVWHLATSPLAGRMRATVRYTGGAGVAALGVLIAVVWDSSGADVLRAERSFHGVLRVQERLEPPSSAVVRDLMHGTTLHGMQYTAPSASRTPLGYYARSSGVGLVLSTPAGPNGRRIGVIGLGIGTLTAYAGPSDRLRYYEINPNVTRLAREMFTFLRTARTRVEVVSGDGRVSLERETPQAFDVLVLDAFSGDAIPSHLLTREAFGLYLRHLAPGGRIAVHIANRHLDLEPVVLAAADAFRLESVFIPGATAGEDYVTDWLLLARDEDALLEPALLLRAGPKTPRRVLWTDEWTSVWRILK